MKIREGFLPEILHRYRMLPSQCAPSDGDMRQRPKMDVLRNGNYLNLVGVIIRNNLKWRFRRTVTIDMFATYSNSYGDGYMRQ